MRVWSFTDRVLVTLNDNDVEWLLTTFFINLLDTSDDTKFWCHRIFNVYINNNENNRKIRQSLFINTSVMVRGNQCCYWHLITIIVKYGPKHNRLQYDKISYFIKIIKYDKVL